MAFPAPTLHADKLLEIGVGYVGNYFLISSNVEAYDTFVRNKNSLKIDQSLDMHLMIISGENSNQATD